jgi:hypothetical protein
MGGDTSPCVNGGRVAHVGLDRALTEDQPLFDAMGALLARSQRVVSRRFRKF